MLRICLKIQNAVILEALEELLPQAGVCLKTEEVESDGVLCTSSCGEGSKPSLDFSSLLKPMRFTDLLSQVRNFPYCQEISISHFSLDIREKLLKNQKTQVEQRLTEKECQLLRFFHQNKGEELSKDKLLKEIWEYHPDTETHTLETHIYRLRQKLEDDPNNPQILLNGKDGYWMR